MSDYEVNMMKPNDEQDKIGQVSKSAQATCNAYVVAVEYPEGELIAQKLLESGNIVLQSGANPAHLGGIANLIANSHGLFKTVITDESNVHFFSKINVDIVVNKLDIPVAA